MNWEQLLESYWAGDASPAQLEQALASAPSPAAREALTAALALGADLARLLEPLTPPAREAFAARLEALPTPAAPAWLAAELGLPAPAEPTVPAEAEAFFAGDAPLTELERAAAEAEGDEAGQLEAASQLGRQLRDLLGGLPAPRPLDPDDAPRPRAESPAFDVTPERVHQLARLLRGERAQTLVESDTPRLHVDPALLRRGPLATLIRRALTDALAACRASEATLWLLSADGERLQGVINQVWDGTSRPELEQADVPVAVSAIGQVITQGRARRLGPTAYQDPVVSWSSGVEVRGMLAAPVRLGDAVVGVVSAVNPQGRELFAADDLVGLVWQAHVLGLVLADCLAPAVQERPPWRDPATDPGE